MKLRYDDLLAKTNRKYQPLELDYDGKPLTFRNMAQLNASGREQMRLLLDRLTEDTSGEVDSYELFGDVLGIAVDDKDLWAKFVNDHEDNPAVVQYLFETWTRQGGVSGERKP